MKRILPILKTVGHVFQGVALASVFAMNTLMGYILFAPDDLPKPFYLAYAGEAVVLPPAGQTDSGHSAESTPTPDPSPEVVRIYKPGQGVMVETGTKIVNLADPGGRRYLKASITVEVAPPEAEDETTTAASSTGEGATGEDPVMAEFNDKMNNRLPIINDILTTLLSGKTFEAIYTVEGKEDLRQEILTQLNDRLPELQVIAVYFTEFVVQ